MPSPEPDISARHSFIELYLARIFKVNASAWPHHPRQLRRRRFVVAKLTPAPPNAPTNGARFPEHDPHTDYAYSQRSPRRQRPTTTAVLPTDPSARLAAHSTHGHPLARCDHLQSNESS